jgi:uncharacterized protein YndB with AHSA1/START domain
MPVEREVAFTGIFDAPRELVFKAWTDPKHMAQWWGPRVFTNPVCEIDVRGLVAGADRTLAGMEAGWTQSQDKPGEHTRTLV